MQVKNTNKEILRFLFTIFTVFSYTIFAFSTSLINQENQNIFIQNLLEDFDRFLNINLNSTNSIEIIILGYSILLVSFISSSYWYNNPHLYVENDFRVYLKIFSLTTLFIVFFFYFLRINNVSRLYFLIYILVMPVLFLFFRSNGIFSKYIIRQIIADRFLHLNDSNSYGDEIYLYKQFNKVNEVDKLSIDNADESNVLISVGEIQKVKQFDFILLNVENFSSFTKNILLDLSIFKKPIFLALKNVNEEIISDLIIKKIERSHLNLFFLNLKVQDGLGLLFKRIFDILTASLLLIVLLPLSVYIIIFIYIQDFQNPFVSIKRSGIYGREFKMYKFRTMKIDSHKRREDFNELNNRKGPLFKIVNDPRIIKNLSWIRNYSLDELPQLLNVIKGEMSLVGPRPLFNDDLQKFQIKQTMRLNVLPGITGLLQINDRETESFDTWFYWDKEYIENWSLFLDLQILLMTPFRLKKSK